MEKFGHLLPVQKWPGQASNQSRLIQSQKARHLTNQSKVGQSESLNCSQCKKINLKIRQSLLEWVQICNRCWKTEEFSGPEGLFWRTQLSERQTRDSRTTFTKQKKQKNSWVILWTM